MGDSLAHRGPDGGGSYEDEPHRFFMGMRRLSIIDLDGGWQPIYNEDRSLAVCFNGEIYNYIELHDQLVEEGHVFRTRSETEVIVHAYEKWGRECVRHFNGMFAFATAHVEPALILDLPSGHGRVCRMLRAAFPDAQLTVCDLGRDAVDFCAAQFNATPTYSQEDIRRVSLDQSFDLIWCGSLFTHLDREQWPAFLGFFADHLSPDGVLVFTTHGRQPIQWMREGFFDYGLSEEERRALIKGYVKGRFGSGPKKRSSMDSSSSRRTSPRNPVMTVTPRYGLPLQPPPAAPRSMFAASHSEITLSASHAWELQSWQGSSRAMLVAVSRIV